MFYDYVIQRSGTKNFLPNKNHVETYLVCESMTLKVFENKQRYRVLICDIAPPTHPSA